MDGAAQADVPPTLKTTIRGPDASSAARSEPGPSSARVVTAICRPPAPPCVPAPYPTTAVSTGAAAAPGGLRCGGRLVASLPAWLPAWRRRGRWRGVRVGVAVGVGRRARGFGRDLGASRPERSASPAVHAGVAIRPSVVPVTCMARPDADRVSVVSGRTAVTRKLPSPSTLCVAARTTHPRHPTTAEPSGRSGKSSRVMTICWPATASPSIARLGPAPMTRIGTRMTGMSSRIGRVSSQSSHHGRGARAPSGGGAAGGVGAGVARVTAASTCIAC